MNSALLRPLIVVLVLIGVTSGLLAWRGPKQRLGPPGDKVRYDPLLGGNDALFRTNAIMLPERLTGRLGHQYESRARRIDPDEFRLLPADTGFGRREYLDEVDGFETILSVVLMGTVRASLHRPEHCLGSQGVVITDRKTFQLRTEDGDVEILQCYANAPRNADAKSDPLRLVFADLFLAADRQTSSHTKRHLISMRDLVVRGEMPRWALVTCFTVCRPGEEDANFEKMKRFLTVAIPALLAKSPAHSG